MGTKIVPNVAHSQMEQLVFEIVAELFQQDFSDLEPTMIHIST